MAVVATTAISSPSCEGGTSFRRIHGASPLSEHEKAPAVSTEGPSAVMPHSARHIRPYGQMSTASRRQISEVRAESEPPDRPPRPAWPRDRKWIRAAAAPRDRAIGRDVRDSCSVLSAIAALASSPYVIVIDAVRDLDLRHVLAVRVRAFADMPACVRSAGAVPRFKNVSATAAFAAAAKFMPSETCARIV